MTQYPLDLASITPINARFWAYVNNSPVKITLRPGEVLAHHQSEPTDEGFSYVAHEWQYDGRIVSDECSSGGSDCDGRIDRYHDCDCNLSNLRSFRPQDSDLDQDIMFPNWVNCQAHLRDHAAEAAGY